MHELSIGLKKGACAKHGHDATGHGRTARRTQPAGSPAARPWERAVRRGSHTAEGNCTCLACSPAPSQLHGPLSMLHQVSQRFWHLCYIQTCEHIQLIIAQFSADRVEWLTYCRCPLWFPSYHTILWFLCTV